MARSRAVTVANVGPRANEQDVDTVRAALRTLRPLGIRFSETKEDSGPTVINAWHETAEPRAPRAARGTAELPAPSSEAVAAGRPAPAGTAPAPGARARTTTTAG